MQKNYMTYHMAARLSLWISVALYLFFILSLYFRELIITPYEATMPPVGSFIAISIFGITSMFILLFALFAINFYFLRSDLTRKKKLYMIVSLSVLFAVIYGLTIIYIQINFNPLPPPHAHPNPSIPQWAGIFRDLFLAVIVMFVSQMLYLTQKRQQLELRNEVLEVENMRTRYEALRNQVDPHFLFNTLSILDSLVDEDRQKTHEYIHKFSSVYRYILQNTETVTLGEELRFIDDYFGLMQVRFGDNLKLNLNIDPKFNHHLIVPLGVQTLVENAVKHNVITKQNPLTITITTTGDSNLVISNNYQPKDMMTEGSGVGLTNLSERYNLKWHREITIEKTDTMFSVAMPIIEPQDYESTYYRGRIA